MNDIDVRYDGRRPSRARFELFGVLVEHLLVEAGERLATLEAAMTTRKD